MTVASQRSIESTDRPIQPIDCLRIGMTYQAQRFVRSFVSSFDRPFLRVRSTVCPSNRPSVFPYIGLFVFHLTLSYLKLPCPILPYPTKPNPTRPHHTLPYPILLSLTLPYSTLPYPTLPFSSLHYPFLQNLTLLTQPYWTETNSPYSAQLFGTFLYPKLLSPTCIHSLLPLYFTILYIIPPYHTRPYPTLPNHTESNPGHRTLHDCDVHFPTITIFTQPVFIHYFPSKDHQDPVLARSLPHLPNCDPSFHFVPFTTLSNSTFEPWKSVHFTFSIQTHTYEIFWIRRSEVWKPR